jgi:cobalt-zinc-cadmium efflux system membrane fusion protein
MNKSLLLNILIPVVLMASCTSRENAPEEEITITDSTETSALTMSNALLEYADIEYGSLQNQRLSNDVNARGELVLPVNARADVVSMYPGIINKVLVNRGDPIKKGQILATINSAEFIEAQQKYQMVKNQIVMLKQEYERQKELNKSKISSDKYFQKAQADYNIAQAELKGLILQLELTGISEKDLEFNTIVSELKITSPLNGFIENINVNPGNYVNPDECLFQVFNRDHLLIELNVFEKDILKVSLGQRVTFSLANMNREVHEAKIISIGNTVQQEARVVKVLAEFRNEGGRLLPGMFVSAEIHTGENTVTALPEEAVLRMDDDYFIIFYTCKAMQNEKGTSFKSVEVKLGNIEDGFVQVTTVDEIPEDALIVIKGGYYLKTEQAKREE